MNLPSSIAEEIESARKTHHFFGQFADAFERIRARIEREPVERAELQKVCGDLGIPGSFDIAQLTWKPDYDSFYYQQLCRRARRLYLFREEYIFDLESAIVAEIPQLGHATYVFAKRRSIEEFLAGYIRTSKEDIRRNRDNIAETLGFVCRVVHGVNGRLWLNTLKSRIGEPADHSDAA